MMKTKLFAAAALAAMSAWAKFEVNVDTRGEGLFSSNWTPVQFGIAPQGDCQLFPSCAVVEGVALGLPWLRQETTVLSFALVNECRNAEMFQIGLWCVSERNWALQLAPVNLARRNLGMSVGVVNLEENFGYRTKDVHPELPGVQIGLFNAGGGFQIGLLNYNPHGFAKWFPIVNFPWK